LFQFGFSPSVQPSLPTSQPVSALRSVGATRSGRLLHPRRKAINAETLTAAG
jgi:hypothetical protein